MKINFIFSAHSVKSHHVSVREPKLLRYFFLLLFFLFSCLPSWVVGVVRKPKILFSFSINRRTHTHTWSWTISTHFGTSELRAFRLRSISLYISRPPSLVKEIPTWNVCQACPIRNCISLILLNVLFRCLCSYIFFDFFVWIYFEFSVLYLAEMAFFDAKIHINKNKSHAEV